MWQRAFPSNKKLEKLTFKFSEKMGVKCTTERRLITYKYTKPYYTEFFFFFKYMLSHNFFS